MSVVNDLPPVTYWKVGGWTMGCGNHGTTWERVEFDERGDIETPVDILRGRDRMEEYQCATG